MWQMQKRMTIILGIFLACAGDLHCRDLLISTWTCGNDVMDLVPADDGFWAVTTGGLVHWNSATHQYQKFTTSEGLQDNWYVTGVRDLTGNYWFGSLMGGIANYNHGEWSCLGQETGILSTEVLSSDVDFQNRLWFGFGEAFGSGLGILNNGSWTYLRKDDGLNHNKIRAILTDNGGAWVGSPRGLNRIEEDKVVGSLTTENGLIHNDVNDLVKDSNGTLWIATSGGVSSLYGSNFTSYTTEQGLPSNNVQSICMDNQGRLWAGTDQGLAFFSQSLWVIPETGAVELSGNVQALISYGASGLLCAVIGKGVFLLENNLIVDQFKTADYLPDNHIRSMALEGDTVWFGCAGGQVGSFDGENWQVFNPQEGLEPGWIRAVAIDLNGVKWFGSFGNGVFRYDEETWLQLTEADGLASNDVMGIFVDDDNSLWITTFGGGVSRYDGQTWTVIDNSIGLPSDRTYMVKKEQLTGDYWISHDLGVTRYRDGEMDHYFEEDGLVFHRVYEIEIDRNNVKWFGACKGLSRFEEGDFTNFYGSDGLPHYRVRDVNFDKNGLAWIATGRGICYFNGAYFEAIQPKHGLAGYETYNVLIDSQGRLWTGSKGGISRIQINSLDNSKPRILMAGSRYLNSPQGRHVIWEAIPSDPDQDNLAIELSVLNESTGIMLNDKGRDGDAAAGDGVFSLAIPLTDPLPSGQYETGLIVKDVKGAVASWPAVSSN